MNTSVSLKLKIIVFILAFLVISPGIIYFVMINELSIGPSILYILSAIYLSINLVRVFDAFYVENLYFHNTDDKELLGGSVALKHLVYWVVLYLLTWGTLLYYLIYKNSKIILMSDSLEKMAFALHLANIIPFFTWKK